MMKQIFMMTMLVFAVTPVFAERTVQCPKPSAITISQNDEGEICWMVPHNLQVGSAELTEDCALDKPQVIDGPAYKGAIDHYADDPQQTFLFCYYPADDGKQSEQFRLLVQLDGNFKQIGPISFVQTP